MLEEIEEHVLAPVDVVEHGDDRPLGRDRLEQLAKRPRDLVGRGRAAVSENRGQRLRRNRIQLDSRPVRLELLQHLDHRPVGDPLAVGEAAAANGGRVRSGEELRHEARLPHPRRADDGHELAARAAAYALPGLSSAPSSCVRPTSRWSRRRSTAASETARSRQAGTGSPFPFSSKRLDGLGLDCVARQAKRRLAEQDLPRLRCLLEPRRDVDGVPGRQPLLGARDDLAGVDADPALDAELGKREAQLRRRPQRAQRRRPRARPAARTPP